MHCMVVPFTSGVAFTLRLETVHTSLVFFQLCAMNGPHSSVTLEQFEGFAVRLMRAFVHFETVEVMFHTIVEALGSTTH